MKNLKADIIQLVNKLHTFDELNLVHNILHKKVIQQYIELFLSKKGLQQIENVEYLTNLILFQSSATIEEKISFCHLLLDSNNLIIEDMITSTGNKTICNHTALNQSKVFHDIKLDIMNKINFKGLGIGQLGRGEIFFLLFGKNTVLSDIGDINTDGINVEIKGSGARCRGMKGYNSPKNINLPKFLKDRLNIELNTVTMSITKWKAFNVELEKCEKDNVIAVFKAMFKEMYTIDLFDDICNLWLDKIIVNGLLHEKSVFYLTAMQIDYYKSIEKWDKLMFIIPLEFKAIVIKDGLDFMLYYNRFKVSNFSWLGTDSRLSVGAITYIG